MSSVIKLLDIQCILFKFDDCALVIIHITIVRCAKYSDNSWKFLCTVPLVHLITIKLSFMCPQYRQKSIFVQEIVRRLLSKEVGAASNVILSEFVSAGTLFIIDWIGP